MIERLGRGTASVLVAVATAVVIVALAILPFVNPIWVSFEQGRARADLWTGYAPGQLREVTDAILSDLVFGPPEFDVTVAGQAVLNPRERSHMMDVRQAFITLAIAAVISAVVLIVTYAVRRGPGFWRPVRAGAAVLGALILLVGAVGAFAFDATFEIFHRLFFAAGTYGFDARTDRLVQIFPEQFWFDTGLTVGAVVLILCLAVFRAGAGRIADDAREPRTASTALEASR